MSLALIFFVISLVFHKGINVFKTFSIFVGFLYLLLSGADDEVQRWMGQKLSLSFIKTYLFAFTDTGLTIKIFLGGLGHFLLDAGIVVAATAGEIILAVKLKPSVSHRRFSLTTGISFGLVLLFAVIGSTSPLWYNPSNRRWARIQPVAYTLIKNVFEDSKFSKKPTNYREGIILLGGNPDKEYPFWKEAENEQKSLEAFLEKPLEEKPDIILFTIESLRGWTSDIRVEATCKALPNLCRLAKSGLYYPYAYSVGNPSVEGLLGIMVGINSYPRKPLLREFPNERILSFSEILSKAGYNTEVVLGADPRFDHEEGWYSKWFNYFEFKPDYDGDVTTANRFVERYKNRPKDKPNFFHWMSMSMHLPFTLPKNAGKTPSDRSIAYTRAEAYMDSALGIILDSIAKDPRFNNTLFILTGDHSIANGKQMQEQEKLGQAADGMTWISLVFAGKGITPRIDTRIVSQQDIAPSIINYLNLDVSNHFMGINIIESKDSFSNKESPAIYSFRQGSMAMRKDSIAYHLVSVDDKNLAVATRISPVPDWDTTNRVDGFISGEPLDLPRSLLEEKTDEMKAVAAAWTYIVFNNKLMPEMQ